MNRLKIYDSSIPREQIIAEREAQYLVNSPKDKLERLFSLINISVSMNGGKPLKHPQGKGLIISRKK